MKYEKKISRPPEEFLLQLTPAIGGGHWFRIECTTEDSTWKTHLTMKMELKDLQDLAYFINCLDRRDGD